MNRRPPRNGENLLRMRHEGWRPEGLVLVSLVGSLGFDNYTTCADPGSSFDWSMLAGLEVELVVSTSVPFGAVLHALADIAAAVPASLSLYYVEGPRVDCGRSRYVLESLRPTAGRMLFDWCPVSAVTASPDSTRLAQRLWRELGGAIPTPCDVALARLQILLEKELRNGADNS